MGPSPQWAEGGGGRGCWTVRPLVYVHSEATDAAIRRFVHRGSDQSLLYEHVLSPLASWLVEWLPRWMAPNLVTLVGLCFPLSAALIFAWHCPALDCTAAPRWPHLYGAAAILIYQTFDNMDGKQARRTKSSSPLGMLFDHGCDAINCVLLVVSIPGCVLSAGHNDLPTLLGLLMTSFTPFFFSTWDHYTRGQFVLPPINGPNEGLVCAALLGVCSWWHGVEWWWRSPWEGDGDGEVEPRPWRRIELLWAVSYFGQVVTALAQLALAARSIRAATGRLAPFGGALLNLLPHALVLACAIVWIHCAPDVPRRHPRDVLLLCGCAHVEICTSMMHCLMTELPYSRSHLSLLPLGIVAVSAAVGWHLSAGVVRALVVGSCARTVLCYAQTAKHSAGALGIGVFRIRTKEATQ